MKSLPFKLGIYVTTVVGIIFAIFFMCDLLFVGGTGTDNAASAGKTGSGKRKNENNLRIKRPLERFDKRWLLDGDMMKEVRAAAGPDENDMLVSSFRAGEVMRIQKSRFKSLVELEKKDPTPGYDAIVLSSLAGFTKRRMFCVTAGTIPFFEIDEVLSGNVDKKIIISSDFYHRIAYWGQRIKGKQFVLYLKKDEDCFSGYKIVLTYPGIPYAMFESDEVSIQDAIIEVQQGAGKLQERLQENRK